jgi:hypothetical protein
MVMYYTTKPYYLLYCYTPKLLLEKGGGFD